MQLLIVNAGSSSLRVALYDVADTRPVRLESARYDARTTDLKNALRTFIEQNRVKHPLAVAHRFVHGGENFSDPVLVTPQIKQQLRELVPLAPLHNPYALDLITEMEQQYDHSIRQIAVFDTAFYKDMPAVAKTYALPADLCKQHGLHRYGFHGFAHEYMVQHARDLIGNANRPLRSISLQLGSGCSITASHDGKAQDTSMGFSPLEGLVMGTRSGDVDPGLVLFLQRELGYSTEQLEEILNEQSGLLGVSGMSADMRDLVNTENEQARLAVELFCYRARKYIGSYLAAMNGADVILFGGGIGENMPLIREKILGPMSWCGMELDPQANQASIARDACISRPDSEIKAWVIKVDEEERIAETACSLLQKE